METTIGCLVKVINENSTYYNKNGIITVISNKKLGIVFSKKGSDWFFSYEIEYLCDEPQFNFNFYYDENLCFWCSKRLKRYYVKGIDFSYCPKCLR